VDEFGVILAGHTRLLAAQQLKLTEAPVHQVTDMSLEKKQAYRLADNRTGEYARWDDELLALEMKELVVTNYDLAQTGFSVGQIRKFTDTNPYEERKDADYVAPQRAKLGNRFSLGEHILMVGDATNAERVARTVGQFRPGMMITDPALRR
jgi:hypothetical protein